ncbi:AAA family ATPase [Fuchsiella alkaliacetigena]|uniref:AAA family ATPase n=1 Tax=Fuchsiella alkaliacetigena TaxID=957042 RepID=UPI00200A351B|nr:AAA family ATPase [Fuchsiella alkaliacetigena]MCK8824189.1 ATP-binding protein [Fuchsiella alkaliacetigena]
MRKIPYGISDFKSLREEDYIYVDKTEYIEILENYDERYLLFLRPRRFGKSLFVSLLATYYDINNKDEFNKYFKDLYIADNKTDLANSYYILEFNFSGIDTSDKESSLQGFRKKVLTSLKSFANNYNLDLDYDKTGLPAEIFNSFLTEIKYKIDGKIYLLIDEYDHFANELLSFQVNLFEETVSKTGFVRKWYEILKEGTQIGVVDRIFITGVSPVTLDSLTSGFNIGSNISRDRALNEMMGFREKEVLSLLEQTLEDKVDKQELMIKLKDYYNGYLFNEKVTEKVFNSDMILYYLAEYKKNKEEPSDLVDINIASDYTKMGKLFSLKNKERNYQILEEILNGQTQKTTITRQFSLAKEFSKEDFLSLLYYLGFLTIDSFVLNMVNLKVPNYVIKELYFDFFAKIIEKEGDYQLETIEIKESVIDIALEGKVDKFIKVIEKTLKKLSARDFIKFEEKYVKLLMLSYLMLSKMYYVKSEYEVEAGYIDIAFFERSGLDVDYEGLIELKYIKKSDYQKSGAKLVEKNLEEAKKQLLKYKKADELKSKDNLKKWAIIFAGDQCVKCVNIE